MRNGGPLEYRIRAGDLTHGHIGKQFTVDLPDGRELCTRLDGVIRSDSRPVTILFPVTINDRAEKFLVLDHEAELLMTRTAG